MRDINKKTNCCFKTKQLPRIAFLVVVALITSTACTAKSTPELNVYESNSSSTIEPIEKTIFALDTSVSIKLYDTSDEKILSEALELCNHYEDIFSAHKETSELYKLNHRKEGVNEVEVSPELAETIEKALEYCKLSNGAFDITIEPVQMLWAFDSENTKVPDENLIKEELKKVDYTKVSVDKNIVKFESADTRIDLGAIAKGYIADKIKEFLVKNNVHSAIINLGGNVLCIGKKPNGEKFNVGLQKPFADRRETIGAIEIDDLSVVSSGVYERHFFENGINYHHILNPKTGYPYQNGITQVSIITALSTNADALSTTCFSLGEEKAVELINSITNTYAVFVMENGDIKFSEGAEELVKLESNN